MLWFLIIEKNKQQIVYFRFHLKSKAQNRLQAPKNHNFGIYGWLGIPRKKNIRW